MSQLGKQIFELRFESSHLYWPTITRRSPGLAEFAADRSVPSEPFCVKIFVAPFLARTGNRPSIILVSGKTDNFDLVRSRIDST
jgi:hypothetical protein